MGLLRVQLLGELPPDALVAVVPPLAAVVAVVAVEADFLLLLQAAANITSANNPTNHVRARTL
jgi:hypothetical protein